MADLGLFEAWGIWFEGRSLTGHCVLGLPILWWSRIGKVLAFTGGLTAILDLLGPDVLRRFSERLRTTRRAQQFVATSTWALVGVFMGLVSTVIATWTFWGPFFLEAGVIVIVCAAALVLSGVSDKIFARVASIIEDPKTERWWRVGSFVLLLVGFHFDLLAS
ncbi:hypothetical protein ACFWY5_28210 [Nonomuraea sp. NPDC059007]|uniref:hypothetical protein n=1 Tax=Nonomuraea sp. NPDC059007 TaxID=3346692 RepID=UPI0036B3CA22